MEDNINSNLKEAGCESEGELGFWSYKLQFVLKSVFLSEVYKRTWRRLTQIRTFNSKIYFWTYKLYIILRVTEKSVSSLQMAETNVLAPQNFGEC